MIFNTDQIESYYTCILKALGTMYIGNSSREFERVKFEG